MTSKGLDQTECKMVRLDSNSVTLGTSAKPFSSDAAL